MKKLNASEINSVSGGALRLDNCFMSVSTNGIPLDDYFAIERQYQLVLDGTITAFRAGENLADADVALSSLLTYNNNMEFNSRTFCI